MATANENIRDAMIRHQIGLIRASDTLSKQIIKELRKSEKDIRKQIERRLAEIKDRGFDVGPITTTRLLEIERQLRDLLGEAHRVIQEDTKKFMEELALREPVFVKELIEDALPVIVNFGVPPARVLREIVRTSPIDGKVLRDWLKKFEADDVDRMMDEIRRGLVQGEGIQQITRRIGIYADITNLAALTPYLGGGAGGAYKEINTNFGGDDEDTGLTAHGEAGLSLKVTPNISAVPHYRLAWLDEVGDDAQFAHWFRLGIRLGQ